MMDKKIIYLDNNATTPIHPEVKKALTEGLEVFGNPSSLHSFGRAAREHVENSRKKIASFIGAHEDEIIFVGSGSEANNTVLSILACPLSKCSGGCGKMEIITTKIEHPCILETSKCLSDRGVEIKYLNVDKYGKIDLNQLNDLVTDKTGLVSVMMANNEIGTIQDIKKISEIVHSKRVLLHTDAVQAIGKVDINVNDLGVDFLTISGHKIYGPKGIGALYAKRGVGFCPLIRGGHQERGRRAGTENTLGIIGLAKAVEMRKQEMASEKTRLLELKAILKKGIEDNVSDVSFNGHPQDCLYNTVNVSIAGAEGEAILLYLDLEGICVSTGSACASGSLDPSHVLLATGLSAESAHGSIRVSMGRETTKDEISYFIDVLPKVIKKIRSMSTVPVRSK